MRLETRLKDKGSFRKLIKTTGGAIRRNKNKNKTNKLKTMFRLTKKKNNNNNNNKSDEQKKKKVSL